MTTDAKASTGRAMTWRASTFRLCAMGDLRPSGLAFASALAVVIVAVACASAGPCHFNSDCAVGYYCGTRGLCVRNCVDATRDCSPGEILRREW